MPGINVSVSFSGTLEHGERPYTHVRLFTQADVDAGKIIYRPPQAPSHLQELYQYSFTGRWLENYDEYVRPLRLSLQFWFSFVSVLIVEFSSKLLCLCPIEPGNLY